MKLITGQIRPNIGRVTIKGKPVRNNYPLYRIIGFCPEQDSFYGELSGWEFLKNLLTLYHLSPAEADEKAAKALDIVELTKDKDRVIRSYSRGMRQRLKVAVESADIFEKMMGPLPWKDVRFVHVTPVRKETGVSLPGLILISDMFFRDLT